MATRARPENAPPTHSAPSARGAASADPQSGDERSNAEVLRSLSEQGQALVRKEIELAKLELTEILVARAIALGAVIVGAVMGLFILGFAGVTGAKALDLVLPEWAAWLIVTGIYTLVAVSALLVAKRKATTPPNAPERTKADVTRTIEWLKGQVQR